MDNLVDSIRKDLEEAYTSYKINSERAMQAIVYNSIDNYYNNYQKGKEVRIYVEPGIYIESEARSYAPDIVIVNLDLKKIIAVIELKCMPHWWLDGKKAIYDIKKLATIAIHEEEVKLDLFGPNKVFDAKTRIWSPPSDKFMLSSEVLFIFAAIARENEYMKENRIKNEFNAATLDGKNNIEFIGITIDENNANLINK